MKLQLYTPKFIRLCLSIFLFVLSFNLLIAELQEYIVLIGGVEYKGLVIGFFTLTAALSRPLSGKLTDNIGRKPVMIFGILVCMVIGFTYLWATTVTIFLLIRLLHGFSTGFTPTGNIAYTDDIVPDERRGEALGIVGLMVGLGMSSGPYLGGLIKNAFDFDVLFISSSVVAFLAFLVVFGMEETLPQEKRDYSLKRNLNIRLSDVLEPRVYFPAAVFFMYVLSYSITLTIIPDFSTHLGLENKGSFFVISIGTSVLVRFFAGKVSDTHGRRATLIVGLFFIMVSMYLVGSAKSVSFFFVGAAIMGLGNGICSPSIMAWASDLAAGKNVGRAFSTIFLSLEIAIGLASVISAAIFNNNPSNFAPTFYVMGIPSILAWLMVLSTYLRPDKKF